MNISENRFAQEAIISLVLAGACPEDQKDKLKDLKKWADVAKFNLLVEVQQFLISEADRLIEHSEEFDRYYEKTMNKLKAEKFLEETALKL